MKELKPRYPDCENEGMCCDACSLSSYGRDCRNNPNNNLAFCRLRAGMTQQQLAEKTGWKVMYLSNLETGRRSLGGDLPTQCHQVGRGFGLGGHPGIDPGQPGDRMKGVKP